MRDIIRETNRKKRKRKRRAQKQRNKREQQRTETLEKIRSTADDPAQKAGFEKMTVRESCGRAGVVIGGFYHYFKTKDDLLFDRYARGVRAFEQLEEEVLCKLSPLRPCGS